MPNPSIKDEKTYEGVRKSGASKEKAARVANAAAAQSDLTARAADNTRSMLTGMAKSFGYDAVTVTFDPPAPPAAP